MSKKRRNRCPSPPSAAHDLKRIRREVRRYLDSHDIFEWFEWDDELLDREDYTALLELRRGMVERQPENGHLYLHLADAYALVKDYDRALEVAATLHRAVPESFECQALIMDLLGAQGCDENDFEWLERPSVIRLDNAMKERCLGFLEARDGGCLTFDLIQELFGMEYCLFEEEDLALYLGEDPRFEVDPCGGCDYLVLRAETKEDAAPGPRAARG